MLQKLRKRDYLLFLIVLLLFGFQIDIARHLAFFDWEFTHADRAYLPLRMTPFQDYTPYKTMLAYLFQGPLLALSSHTWDGLTNLRLFHVAFNFGATLLLIMQLRTMLNPTAVLMAAVLACGTTFSLTQSHLVGPDIFTAWAGAFSLLLVLKGRPAWAGLAAGMSFLFSQKGIYFCMAGFVTYSFQFYSENRSERARFALVEYLAAAICTGLIYTSFLGIWGGDFGKVLDAMLVQHYDNSFGQFYEIVPFVRYRLDAFMQNLVFCLLFTMAMWKLLKYNQEAQGSEDESKKRIRRLLPWAASFSLLFLAHTKPWPYFFWMGIPAAIIILSVFFHFHGVEAPSTKARSLRLALLISLGLLGPGYATWHLRTDLDNAYQKAMIKAGETLLLADESYIAGFEMLYNRDQTSPKVEDWHYRGLFNDLDSLSLVQILRMPPSEQQMIIAQLEQAPVKFIIRNKRFNFLPDPFSRYFDQNFKHFWGNIYLYAPRLQLPPADAEQQSFVFAPTLKGPFKVLSLESIKIGDQLYHQGDIINVKDSINISLGPTPVSLRLQWAANAEDLGLAESSSARRLFFPAQSDY